MSEYLSLGLLAAVVALVLAGVAGWALARFVFEGSFTLPVGPWGSLGYDFADVPLASGLDRQQRHGWSVWVQPFQIWRPER